MAYGYCNYSTFKSVESRYFRDVRKRLLWQHLWMGLLSCRDWRPQKISGSIFGRQVFERSENFTSKHCGYWGEEQRRRFSAWVVHVTFGWHIAVFVFCQDRNHLNYSRNLYNIYCYIVFSMVMKLFNFN